MKPQKPPTPSKRPPRAKRTPREPRKERNERFKRRVSTLVAMVGLFLVVSGCARFSTTQKDIRYDGGKLAGAIETQVSSWTLWSSKSSLANFKATQTEKTQGASVGHLNQEATNNLAGVLGAMEGLARELNKGKP